MASATIEPMPVKAPVTTSPTDPTMSSAWQNWFGLALVPRVESVAAGVPGIALTAQAASIGVTALVPSASGLYRLSYFLHVTRAATVSSSVLLTIAHTDGGIALTQVSGTTTNATSSVLSGVIIARCDASTLLSYATTYASVGATTMLYTLTISVETL